MQTICNSDCPHTHPKITGTLCEVFYPYGGKRCHKRFAMLLQESPEAQRLHEEFLKEEPPDDT